MKKAIIAAGIVVLVLILVAVAIPFLVDADKFRPRVEQEASAALLLAQTYDPAVLGTTDMRSITPDPAMAREWYQKAATLGSLDAKQRLAQMQN